MNTCERETPEAEPPLLMTPTRAQDYPKMTDEDFQIFNERQETQVFDMFEEDLLEVIDEVKPQEPARPNEQKKSKPTTNFAPSPMKPLPKSNINKARAFNSRKAIKLILS